MTSIKRPLDWCLLFNNISAIACLNYGMCQSKSKNLNFFSSAFFRIVGRSNFMFALLFDLLLKSMNFKSSCFHHLDLYWVESYLHKINLWRGRGADCFISTIIIPGPANHQSFNFGPLSGFFWNVIKKAQCSFFYCCCRVYLLWFCSGRLNACPMNEVALIIIGPKAH